MNRKPVVTAEICPQCGSLDVVAIEPRWFAVDVDRRADIGWVDQVEFGCRGCATRWE
jgi:hypothetical protein